LRVHVKLAAINNLVAGSTASFPTLFTRSFATGETPRALPSKAILQRSAYVK
jgi:hypothetical protein